MNAPIPYAQRRAAEIAGEPIVESVSAPISADAKYVASKIVTHLWIIFVLLPVVLAILWSLLK